MNRLKRISGRVIKFFIRYSTFLAVLLSVRHFMHLSWPSDILILFALALAELGELADKVEEQGALIRAEINERATSLHTAGMRQDAVLFDILDVIRTWERM